MDMKKILQAVDGAKAKAEVNSSGMRKFLQVVKEAELNQPDPKYAEYAQLMAKYDMLAKEMAPDASGLGVQKGASPDAIASVNAIKAKAAQLAGPNLQAWEQARQKENADSMTQAQANLPAMAAQLEDVGISRLLSIVTEGRGPLNRPTTAESITMKHYTTPVQNVIENASPSMISKYFKAVEQELKEAARPNDRATQLAKRVIERVTIGPDGKVTGGFKNSAAANTERDGTPAPAAAPSNVKPSGATVEYGGETYDVMVFGDKGIRPRIAFSDKVVTAKVYTMGSKMYVLLDLAAQEGVAEDKDPCWDSHKMVGTKKKGGKTVPNCVPKK